MEVVKPLHPAPLTPEDLAIMARCVACNTSRENEYCYCQRYYEADRRDAELMRAAQYLRWAYVCQCGTGDYVIVRSIEAAKQNDALWHMQWSQS
jgi:hypothetical protein